MSHRGGSWRQTTTLVAALSGIALASIVVADSAVQKRQANIADQEIFFAPVPKAVCGPGDKPELALQGQVPYALRTQAGGSQGNSCNLQLLAQVRGEGANWQTTEWREGRGKNRKVCGYHGTAHPTANPGVARSNYGVRVIDISDPTKPVNTAYLNTTSMLDPWESLKVNQRRQILGAVNATSGNGPAAIDIYDIDGDCRYPQLLASSFLAEGQNGGLVFPGLMSHEGSWAPDGLTYYARGGRNYHSIDTTDTTRPKLLSVWQPPLAQSSGHGLSINEDNTRGYFIANSTLTVAGLSDPTVPASNGLIIYDTTPIRDRAGVNPQPKVVGEVYWKDGAGAQHTINMTIGRKPYVVFVDESGSAGNGVATRQAACDLGMLPFPIARFIDMTDETKPRVVSKVMLETHDPANCEKILPDIQGLTSFLYGSHYCSVDNYRQATTMACGYFNSGIRVFDIRDPVRPREIAYYNPAYTTTVSPGSNHVTQRQTQQPGGPDWCAAQVHLDAEQGTLWTTCQDNGLVSLKFTHNAWPFASSTTPPGRQNN
jgi:hypothetical protein